MQPPPPQFAQQPWTPPPKKSSKLFVTVAIVIGAPIAALLVFLMYIGVTAPEIEAQPGNRVAKRHKDTLRDVGALKPGERIAWFYSDGLFSADEGAYFFTEERLVLYSAEWDPPEESIPLGEIADVDIQRSDTWLDDSVVYVTLDDGEELFFPVSAEKDLDIRYVDALREQIAKNR